MIVAAVMMLCTEYYLFFPSHLLSSARLFSLPPSHNSDPGSHSRLLPLPHCGSCLTFLSPGGFSPFFPRRLASNCAYQRYEPLSAADPSFFFLQIVSRSHHSVIRTPGPTLLIALMVAFEGIHQTTEATSHISKQCSGVHPIIA